MKNKLIEYRIETPSELMKVYKLWKKFFSKDSYWHYTLEGTYIEIRLSKRNPQLEKYLTGKKWKYISFPYIDNIETTRNYQSCYEKIFHGYADLVMTIIDRYNKKEEERKKEVLKTLERATHLLFNLYGFGGMDEAKWLADYALGRAHFTGFYESSIAATKEELKLKEKEKK